MLYKEDTTLEIAHKLNQLGLSRCPVCDSETIGADRRPVILPIGGVPWPNASGQLAPREQSANVLFMVRVECQVCGHALLFNSERFFGGNAPTLEVE